MENIKKLSRKCVMITRGILRDLDDNGECHFDGDCDDCGLGELYSIDGVTNCTFPRDTKEKLTKLLNEYDEYGNKLDSYKELSQYVDKICIHENKRYRVVGYCKDLSERLIVADDKGWDILKDGDFVKRKDMCYTYLRLKDVTFEDQVYYVITNSDRTLFFTNNGRIANIYECPVEVLIFDTIESASEIEFGKQFIITAVDKISFIEWFNAKNDIQALEVKAFSDIDVEYIVISADKRFLVLANGSVLKITEILTCDPNLFIFKKTRADRIKTENGGVLQVVNREKIEKAIKKNNSAVDSFVKLLGGIK